MIEGREVRFDFGEESLGNSSVIFTIPTLPRNCRSDIDTINIFEYFALLGQVTKCNLRGV